MRDLIFKCDSYIGNKDQAVGELLENGDIKKYMDTYNWDKNIYEEGETQKCLDCKLLPICQGGMSSYEKGTKKHMLFI
ncbi:MAG: SPASM domain-containing protein [Elusimicrobiota bacterium]